jgi:hypothetical protein
MGHVRCKVIAKSTVQREEQDMTEGLAAVQNVGAQTPKGKDPAGDLTSAMKAVTGAMALADGAVRDLRQAIRQTRGVNVSGMDPIAYLKAELAPVMAEIGVQLKPVRKARGAQA